MFQTQPFICLIIMAILGMTNATLVTVLVNNETTVYQTARTGFCKQDFVNVTGPVLVAYPTTACSDLTNGDDLYGAIVIVDTGNCSPQDKIRVVQKYGAVAVVYRDTNPEIGRDYATSDGKPFDDLLIPCAFISIYDGYTLEGILAKNISIDGSLSAQISIWEEVMLSKATLGIWIVIHLLHLGVIILGVVLLIQNIRAKRQKKKKILPMVIIPLIIASCIARIFSHLMGSYAQAYTITTPERALNPHWTIPSLLYAIAESLLQVGYCVLAFSWYSAISSKKRIVPNAIKKMRRPVMIVSIVIGSVQIIGFLVATLLWVSVITLIFGVVIMAFWLALTITYIIAAIKLYKALDLKNAYQSAEQKRKIHMFIRKVVALTIAFFLNFVAGLLQVTVGGNALAYLDIVYPFFLSGAILASMVITMLAFFRIDYSVNTSSHSSNNNSSKPSAGKSRSNTTALVPVNVDVDTSKTENQL
eukprot:TRINITY_DN507_c0_g1_i1.p1 TRINITY_DN507_c0_g1~~TRINITY_DN507_c0_g1_i1.p1  ORF type:complete len:474 (-),score=20.90 TRINITY_DN507_c0_g1_i1:74-1495(-)